jgi:arabinofuranosyltransferase
MNISLACHRLLFWGRGESMNRREHNIFKNLALQGPLRLPGLVLFLSAVAFVLYALYFDNGPYSVYDDSFISFRYARNLAQGHGLVFNPGERVEGYTNFLWTVLTAGAIALGVDVIIASKMLATVAGIATLWLTFHVGRQELGDVWPGVLAAGMLAVTVSFARYAVSGFEMLLYGMLVLLGLYLYLRALKVGTIPASAGIALALAAITRPEGTIVYGAVTLHYLFTLWLKPVPGTQRLAHFGGWLASFSLVYVPYFIWRYSYYGYLLPNTFYAKVGEPNLVLLSRGLLYLQEIVLLANPQVVLCLGFGYFWAGRRTTQVLLYGLVGVYLTYIVAVGGDMQEVFGSRFLIPLLPVMYVLGVGGMKGLAARLDQRKHNLLWVGFVGALICIFVIWSRFERRGYLSLQQEGWITLGHWLNHQAQPDDTLAIDAAGIVPFYSTLYTIDMFGLNDLHIAHLTVTTGQGFAGHDKSAPAYVLNRRPTYIATWLDQDGHARQAGLPTVLDQLEADYILWAVVLMRPPATDEAPIVVDPDYTLDLYRRGYTYGVFRRKDRTEVKQ